MCINLTIYYVWHILVIRVEANIRKIQEIQPFRTTCNTDGSYLIRTWLDSWHNHSDVCELYIITIGHTLNTFLVSLAKTCSGQISRLKRDRCYLSSMINNIMLIPYCSVDYIMGYCLEPIEIVDVYRNHLNVESKYRSSISIIQNISLSMKHVFEMLYEPLTNKVNASVWWSIACV